MLTRTIESDWARTPHSRIYNSISNDGQNSFFFNSCNINKASKKQDASIHYKKKLNNQTILLHQQHVNC